MRHGRKEKIFGKNLEEITCCYNCEFFFEDRTTVEVDWDYDTEVDFICNKSLEINEADPYIFNCNKFRWKNKPPYTFKKFIRDVWEVTKAVAYVFCICPLCLIFMFSGDLNTAEENHYLYHRNIWEDTHNIEEADPKKLPYMFKERVDNKNERTKDSDFNSGI